jgi:hypothetical protein
MAWPGLGGVSGSRRGHLITWPGDTGSELKMEILRMCKLPHFPNTVAVRETWMIDSRVRYSLMQQLGDA